jgi:hypothetical protein
VHRVTFDERVIERELELELRDADAAGGVSLRIGIDQEGPPLRDGERRGEVDGGRSLPDTAFLIGDRNRICHGHASTKCLLYNDL